MISLAVAAPQTDTCRTSAGPGVYQGYGEDDIDGDFPGPVGSDELLRPGEFLSSGSVMPRPVILGLDTEKVEVPTRGFHRIPPVAPFLDE